MTATHGVDWLLKQHKTARDPREKELLDMSLSRCCCCCNASAAKFTNQPHDLKKRRRLPRRQAQDVRVSGGEREADEEEAAIAQRIARRG